jgi:hypothetical protein
VGNGDGTFRAAINSTISIAPAFAAVGDFEGDGSSDLVVTTYSFASSYNSDAVEVLRSQGDGTFREGLPYTVGASPSALAVADLNGDGSPDLAVANYGSGTVSVLPGQGHGVFRAAAGYGVGDTPVALAEGDFDGDGTLDLVVANSNTRFPDTINILLGNGDGTFQNAGSYGVGDSTRLNAVAVGDFTGDGVLDLAVTDSTEHVVYILMGTGAGSFYTSGFYPVGDSPSSVAAGDFRRDGVLDLVIADSLDNTVSVLLGNGNGTFRKAATYAVGHQPRSVAVADFDGDGIPDIAVANAASDTVSILRGNGDGTFQAPVDYATDRSPSAVAVGDFNANGVPDLAVAASTGGTVDVLLGQGDGTFQAPVRYTVGVYPTSVAVGDFNGDGIPDLAVANTGSTAANGSISLLLGQGDGTFQPALSYDAGSQPAAVAVGDFNGDGAPDLAVPNAITSGTVTVLLNAADWNRSQPQLPRQPRLPAIQPPAARQPHLDPRPNHGTAQDPQALWQSPLTPSALPPQREASWPLAPDQDPPPLPEARLTPPPAVSAPDTHDIVFEGWEESLLDRLAAIPWQPLS